MGSPQEIVKKIVDTYGAEIYCQKNRLLGLLADYMAANIKSKKILSNAVKDNIPQKLYDLRQVNENDRELNIARIKVFLKDDNGLEEATANFSVDCFAYALGWEIEEASTAENTNVAKKNPVPQLKKNNTNKENHSNNKIINMTSTVLTKDDVEKYLRENNIRHPFSLIVPDGCTKIEDKAFKDCKLLKSITLPNTVEYIGEHAFWNCKALANINIPVSLKKIGSYAFWSCVALENIVIPKGIRSIEKGTFHTCDHLKKITLPNSVMEIGEGAFQYCGWLTELILPGSVIKIRDEAFAGCSSLTITVPNSVSSIGEKAFDGYVGPKVVCRKGSYCERYCKLNGIGSYRLTLK